MDELCDVRIRLSDNQIKKIIDAYKCRKTIIIRIRYLQGPFTIRVWPFTKKMILERRDRNKGIDLKFMFKNNDDGFQHIEDIINSFEIV